MYQHSIHFAHTVINGTKLSLRNLKKCGILTELPEISINFHTQTHLPKAVAAITDSVISKKLLQDESSYHRDAMTRYRFFCDV